jgi:hypothetical protein
MAGRHRNSCSKRECPSEDEIWARASFQFRSGLFFSSSKKSRNRMEMCIYYVAQAIPQIDVEIAKKGHFWMETRENSRCMTSEK